MSVVDNVTEIGWFAPGPAPGDPGSSVLAAHVDMANAGPGVFFRLDQLAAGDTVVVTHGDGSVLSYRVTGTRTVDKGMLDLDAVFTQSGPSTLTLITCGGGFNRSLRRYDSNVVVVAEPIGGGS